MFFFSSNVSELGITTILARLKNFSSGEWRPKVRIRPNPDTYTTTSVVDPIILNLDPDPRVKLKENNCTGRIFQSVESLNVVLVFDLIILHVCL